MALRYLACNAVLAVGLSIALATTVNAANCNDHGCARAAKSDQAAKPLQLGQFMRTSSKSATHAAKTHAAKSHKSAGKQMVKASRRRPAAPTPPAEPLPEAAADAFASQPAQAVQVVDSEQFNEIDRAAGPAWPETTGLAPIAAAEDAVKVVETDAYNDIDRKSDILKLASAASARATADETAQSKQETSPPANPSWVERFWDMVRHTFAAIAAGWHYLFG